MMFLKLPEGLQVLKCLSTSKNFTNLPEPSTSILNIARHVHNCRDP